MIWGLRYVKFNNDFKVVQNIEERLFMCLHEENVIFPMLPKKG